jgi:uncharacterized protein (DUF2342 family)
MAIQDPKVAEALGRVLSQAERTRSMGADIVRLDIKDLDAFIADHAALKRDAWGPAIVRSSVVLRARAETAEAAAVEAQVLALNQSALRKEAEAKAAALAQALADVLPYAIATIGLPREAWPTDSVILAAERLIGEPVEKMAQSA